jgi:hypothetical protein
MTNLGTAVHQLWEALDDIRRAAEDAAEALNEWEDTDFAIVELYDALARTKEIHKSYNPDPPVEPTVGKDAFDGTVYNE